MGGQRWGLLMRAMLRMMELRGLTNFGKRGGGGGVERALGEGGFGVFCCCLFDLRVLEMG